ncbi:hypothetical protein CPB83DRAFT_906941 [Crepidotus variabilis]|uniref:Uncharacterized protein n=1 Tax=Crepidotus variabilis TaxID=179855 RepID=A0A9P6JP77_9AGAR|nr:hypothetical protein CPB83DRAFT_906941 [Crepidotus variabilis]
MPEEVVANHPQIPQGYLSAQSTVISDMLSLPQTGDRELYDGMPVVQLLTSPDDLANFLSIFYDPSHALLAKDEFDLAYKLMGALVLADMLLIEPVKNAIIDRVREDWEIHSVQHWRSKVNAFAKTQDPSKKCRKHLYVEPAAVLHSARRFDETVITPMLIFELAFRDPYLEYHNLEEHILDIQSPALETRWDMFSTSEKRKVRNYREEFLDILATRLPQLRSECTTDYHSDQAFCTKYFRESVDEIFKLLLQGYHPFRLLESNKLNGLRTYSRLNVFEDDIDIYEDAICIPCGRAWDEKLERFQSDLFAEIPMVFQKIW